MNTTRTWTARDTLALAVYVCAAASLGFTDFYVRRNPAYVVTTYIPGVIAGTYEAPFIYRVLAPFLADWLSMITGLKPILAFEALRLASVFASIVAIHVYLRSWFTANASMAGTLAIVALLPLTFTNSWQHPDTFFELFFFAAAAAALVRGRDGLFAGILVLAALNRETSAFLLLLWWAVRFGRQPLPGYVRRGAMLTLAWLAVFVGLRWLRGYQGYTAFVLGKNLTLMNPLAAGVDPRLTAFSWFWVVLTAVPGWLAWKGASLDGAPAFFRRSLLVAGAYLLVALAFSVVAEPRTLVPLFPLMAPGALAAFTSPEIALE